MLNITHNPITGLYQFDGRLFADIETVKLYQKHIGYTDQSQTPTIPPKTVYHLVKCQELGIFREFTDFDTAYTFATQLAQDYPTAHIERAIFTQYFDDWNDDIDTGGKL